MFTFIWNSKSEKVSRNRLIQKQEEGGINALDFGTFNAALKLVWLAKYFSKKIWTVPIAHYFKSIGSLKFLPNCNFQVSKLKLKIPLFYKEILSLWKTFLAKREDDIYNEIIWNNKNILIEKAYLMRNGKMRALFI